MKNSLLRPIQAFVFGLLFLSNWVLAQGPPPAAGPGTAKRIWTEPTLANLTKIEAFSSSDGRFTIKLPRDISGFSSITPKETGVNISGATYMFRVKEGSVSASFWDYLDEDFDLKTEKAFADFFASMKQIPISRMKATLVTESPVNLGAYRGYNFVYDLPDGRRGMLRVFYVDKRAYSLQAVTAKDVANAEQLLTSAFDSFRLLSKAQIDADREKSLTASTPSPLPQTGKRKPTSDAQDEWLKGKVKSVTTETQDLSGTWTIQTRHSSSEVEYDERGDRLKSVSFDSRGNPFQISVYGYIDGDRVSDSKSISYEYDPPPMALTVAGPPDEKKPDPRYDYKYLYNYANGKMSEKKLIMSDGDMGQRITFEWNGNQLTHSIYSQNGKINQKYIYTFDENGNQIAETKVGVLSMDKGQDTKYTYKYESFDAAGNWTKRITSKLTVENGAEVYKPTSVTWRTITYYK